MGVVVLASASPRRRTLFETLGIPFVVDVSSFEEVIDPAASIEDVVRDLAYGKAMDVFARRPDDIVVGADTLVVLKGAFLGKPVDARAATEQLRRLSGQVVDIYTGLAVVGLEHEVQHVVRVPAVIKTLTHRQIDAYIESGVHADKAGGVSVEIIDKMDGPIDAVLGLPLDKLRNALRSKGAPH